MPNTPQFKTDEEIWNGFRQIGEGSVRFMATRKEVFDYFSSAFSSRMEWLEGEVRDMKLTDEHVLNSISAVSNPIQIQYVYNRAIDDVLSLINQLKQNK